ncbi:MAG: molecular chaperone TorD family protein, partial [Candidatus Bathyarchaeia archaeon]
MTHLIDFMRSRWSIYNFLSRVYEKEITESLLKEMVTENTSMGLRRLFEEEYLNVAEAFNDLKECLKALIGDVEKNVSKLAQEYAYLFLGLGGLPHPSESSYLNGDGLLMQDLRDQVLSIYSSLGVEKNGDYRELEDHIAVELQFMAYLCRRSIESFAKGEEHEGKRYLETQKDFLCNHLAVWVPKLAENVLEKARTDFYKIIACITEEFLKAEKNTLNKLTSLSGVCFNGSSFFEEFPRETLIKPTSGTGGGKLEVKSYYKLLGLCGIAQGGNLVRVDVEAGRIIRIVPVHYDEQYKPEELESVRWRVDARG